MFEHPLSSAFNDFYIIMACTMLVLFDQVSLICTYSWPVLFDQVSLIVHINGGWLFSISSELPVILLWAFCATHNAQIVMKTSRQFYAFLVCNKLHILFFHKSVMARNTLDEFWECYVLWVDNLFYLYLYVYLRLVMSLQWAMSEWSLHSKWRY